MPRYEIICINKDNRNDPYMSIQYVGVKGEGKFPQQQIVEWIDNRVHSFFVRQNGREVDVITAEGPSGRRYIKTAADGYGRNNLLALPECS